jgi:hypothetical protein
VEKPSRNNAIVLPIYKGKSSEVPFTQYQNTKINNFSEMIEQKEQIYNTKQKGGYGTFADQEPPNIKRI